jgi:hypothetical protein
MLTGKLRTSFIVVVMLAAAMDLAAQTKSTYELGYPFLGFWTVAPNGKDFNQATSCGPAQGGAGRCSIPLDRIKPYLHPRTLAWMQFGGITDERLSGKWECVATPLPSALEDPFTMRMPSETVMHIQGNWDNDYVRTVYMDGRKHLDGYDRLSYRGDSIGWFDGDDLVIETTNFTFDPDGLDDHLHLPSSPRKKVTERYHKTAPDKMALTITHEDELFLKKPFSWTINFIKGDPTKVSVFGLPYEPTPCSVEAAHQELELLIDKYEGK